MFINVLKGGEDFEDISGFDSRVGAGDRAFNLGGKAYQYSISMY